MLRIQRNPSLIMMPQLGSGGSAPMPMKLRKASVIIAALNNLYPLINKRLWIVAFIFGLVHGLGFANVLTELALPKSALAVSLVSFNLGVEAGQLAIVATFLPLAYMSRRSWLYPRLVLGAGSACIVAVAAVWLIERSLDIGIFF